MAHGRVAEQGAWKAHCRLPSGPDRIIGKDTLRHKLQRGIGRVGRERCFAIDPRVPPALPVRKQYDGFSGTVLELIVHKNPSCPKCSSMLAAGNPLWQ